jgi:hypothetical protein
LENCNSSIFCIEEFKVAVEKLRKNKSYKDIDSLVIEALKDRPVESFRRGPLLNSSQNSPYLKLRIGGRGGYRMYFIAAIVRGCVYIAFIHPKKGSLGSANITDEARARFQRRIFECIQSDELYKVGLEGPLLTFSQTEVDKDFVDIPL